MTLQLALRRSAWPSSLFLLLHVCLEVLRLQLRQRFHYHGCPELQTTPLSSFRLSTNNLRAKILSLNHPCARSISVRVGARGIGPRYPVDVRLGRRARRGALHRECSPLTRLHQIQSYCSSTWGSSQRGLPDVRFAVLFTTEIFSAPRRGALRREVSPTYDLQSFSRRKYLVLLDVGLFTERSPRRTIYSLLYVVV